MKTRELATFVVLLLVLSTSARAAPTHSPLYGSDSFGHLIRFDSSLSDSPAMGVNPVQCSVGVAYSGSGSVSLYQVATASTAASDGTLVGTFTASTTSPTTFSPGLPYLKAVATTASSGTEMRIRCSNTQVSSGGGSGSDSTDVIIGANTTDVANPNDINGDGVFTDEIICTRTNADCFYLSSTSGWWGATSTNTTDDTDWSALQEQILYSANFEGDDGYSPAAYVNTACLQLHIQLEITDDIACSHELAKLVWSTDVLITSWSFTGKGASDPVQNTSDGCSFRLNTGILGFTEIAGSELDVPSSDVVINSGDTYRQSVGATVSAGTPLTIAVRDGDFSETGTPTCNSSWGYSALEIRGVVM